MSRWGAADDLTDAEQARVRLALRHLHAKCGTWHGLAALLGFVRVTVYSVASGKMPVSPRMAFRVAKLIEMPIGDLLAGKYPPPGTCPHCGKSIADTAVVDDTE